MLSIIQPNLKEMDKSKKKRGYGKVYDTVPGRIGVEAMERGRSISTENVDWDEIDDDLGRRPNQFALCSCLYALMGMKTSSQALFDTRIQLRNLITLKEQNYNSTEMRLNRTEAELRDCARKKDIAGAKLAMIAKKRLEKRMENTKRAIMDFEDKLNALDDIRDGKESSEALKAIGKNMRHLNLPKRLNDIAKATDAINDNKSDMQELQTLLQPPPMISADTGLEVTEEELNSEVEALMREMDLDLNSEEEVLSIPEIQHTKPNKDKSRGSVPKSKARRAMESKRGNVPLLAT